VRRHACEAQEIVKASSPKEHFPHNQKRPFIADLRNGARDGAGLRRKVRAAHQKSLLFLN
jgi:hypothetical protein